MDAITRALTGEQKKKLAEAVAGLDPISQLLAGQDGRNEQMAQTPVPNYQPTGEMRSANTGFGDYIAGLTGSPDMGHYAGQAAEYGKMPAQLAKAMTLDPLVDGGTAMGEGAAQDNMTKALGGAAYAGLSAMPFSKLGIGALTSIPKMVGYSGAHGASGGATFGKYDDDPVGDVIGDLLQPSVAHAGDMQPPMPSRNPRRPHGAAPQPVNTPAPPVNADEGGGLMDGITKALSWAGDQFGTGEEAPDFDPMTFEQYKQQNLSPPPSMTDYVTDQANKARSEYLRQRPGWSKGAARSAKAAGGLAEQQYPAFLADYDRRKDGLQGDYDQYVGGQKAAYNKHYSKRFNELHPILSGGLTGLSYGLPYAFTKRAFNKINATTARKTQNLLDLKKRKDPIAEAIASKELQSRARWDPALKTAAVTQSALMPVEAGMAENVWDAHHLPEGTPAQSAASGALSMEGLAEMAPTRMLAGVLSAGAGLKGANPSALPNAKANLLPYTKPAQFDDVVDGIRQRSAATKAEAAVGPDRQAFYEAQAKNRYQGKPELEAPQGQRGSGLEPKTPAPTPAPSPNGSGQSVSGQVGSVSGSGRSSGASGREYIDIDRAIVRESMAQNPAIGQQLGQRADITGTRQTNKYAKEFASHANDFVGGDPLRMAGQKPTPGVNGRTKSTMQFLQANMKGGNPISWEELVGKIPNTPQYLAVPGAVGLGVAMSEEDDPIMRALLAQSQGGF